MSSVSTVYVEEKLVPGELPETASALVAAALPLVKVTVGVVTFSFVAIVNVTTSPVVASVAVELSLALMY